MRAVSYEISNR